MQWPFEACLFKMGRLLGLQLRCLHLSRALLIQKTLNTALTLALSITPTECEVDQSKGSLNSEREIINQLLSLLISIAI